MIHSRDILISWKYPWRYSRNSASIRLLSSSILHRFPSKIKALRTQTNGIPAKSKPLPVIDWDRGGRTEKDGLTPLYASMRKLIDLNPGCVCLIQVGSFYELYFEQAEAYAPKLGLKIASRKTNNYIIPMAGFPTYQLQKFVKVLVQDIEVSVAIIDQYPMANKSTETIIHRKISRIVSPGTLVDESFLNYNQNNYLAAISFPAHCTKVPSDPDLVVGLSWIDLSVGEFYVQKTTLEDLMADISRINPSEIIISKEFQNDNLTNGSWYPSLQDLRKYFLRYHKTVYKDLKHQFRSNIQTTRKLLEIFSTREEAAMHMVLSYINVNIPDSNPSLDVPIQYWNERCLQMDARTREALELTERSASGRTSVIGSLFSTIKKTITPSGTRLLTQWIKSPILDVTELRRRQSFVTLFKDNEYLALSLRSRLSQLGDFARSIQRLSFGTGDTVSHLSSIAEGLTKLEQLESFLSNEANSNPDSGKILSPLLKQFSVPSEVAREILNTLHLEYNETSEDLMNDNEEYKEEEIGEDEVISDIGISGSYSNKAIEKYREFPRPKPEQTFLFAIKRNFDPVLIQLHDTLDEFRFREKTLIGTIQEQIGTIDPKLSIIKKALHGRHLNVIHVSGKQKSIEQLFKKLEYDVREKRKGSLLYKPNEWGKLQSSIDEQIDAIKEVEKEIIERLRIKVLDTVTKIRNVSKLVDFLDITTSFAILAKENSLVCPKFVKNLQLNINGGRHIVVESSLKSVGEMFIPNNTKVGSDGNLWVISGPNMGGKSTYLRQNALIVILAQIGCFVPASKASLSIVDKIFTRIGASDDLYSDLSTFMVEMVETSNILKHATPRSLAIVDEIGRGTSGKEGLAIAYATLLNLLQVNKCRTLFATHFGKELEALLKSDNINQDKIRYFRTRVLQKDSGSNGLNLIIDHVLEPGISERSYALEVAQMAGFPESALSNANRALKLLS